MLDSSELQSENGLVKANKGRRIVAFIIDHFTLTYFIVILNFLMIDMSKIEDGNPFEMISTMMSIMIPGMLIYIAKDTIRGQSFGKWVMGIMVRDEKKSRHGS